MTPDDFNEYLMKMAKLTSKQAKISYTDSFYSKMCEKYGNQFNNNGIIDEFIDIVNKLKK